MNNRIKSGDQPAFSIDDLYTVMSENVKTQETSVKTILNSDAVKKGDQAALGKLNLEVSKWSNMVSLTSNMVANYKEMLKSIVSNIR